MSSRKGFVTFLIVLSVTVLVVALLPVPALATPFAHYKQGPTLPMTIDECGARFTRAFQADGWSKMTLAPGGAYAYKGDMIAIILCATVPNGQLITVFTSGTQDYNAVRDGGERLHQLMLSGAPSPPGTGTQSGPGITGTWDFTAGCDFQHNGGRWAGTMTLSGAQPPNPVPANSAWGSLVNGRIGNDVILGSTFQSGRYDVTPTGQTVTLIVWPHGWDSRLVLKGNVGSPSQITGTVYHGYANGSTDQTYCPFTMTKR